MRIVLRKPCPFLWEAGRCSVYGVRPAACALFPEFLSLAENEEQSTSREDVGKYPCINHCVDMPMKRKDALIALMRMHRKEVFAGEIYLFGRAGFTIDIREDLSGMCGQTSEKAISFNVQAEALHRSLVRHGWWAGLREKIMRLDREDGVAAVLSGMEIVEALNL